MGANTQNGFARTAGAPRVVGIAVGTVARKNSINRLAERTRVIKRVTGNPRKGKLLLRQQLLRRTQISGDHLMRCQMRCRMRCHCN